MQQRATGGGTQASQEAKEARGKYGQNPLVFAGRTGRSRGNRLRTGWFEQLQWLWGIKAVLSCPVHGPGVTYSRGIVSQNASA